MILKVATSSDDRSSGQEGRKVCVLGGGTCKNSIPGSGNLGERGGGEGIPHDFNGLAFTLGWGAALHSSAVIGLHPAGVLRSS